uniref:Uncharacterized protein n=1 Tax=viral metagenome TaxID=1070528 RepID=A0A6H2A3M5_9ZZZZ
MEIEGIKIEEFIKWLQQFKVGEAQKYQGIYVIWDGSIQALVEQVKGI